MTTSATENQKARRGQTIVMVLFLALSALMYVSIAYKIIKFGP